MNVVIDKLVEVLSSPPELVLSSNRLGSKRPSGSNDLPAVAISLSLETGNGVGLGRFVRSGDTIVKSTNVIEVKATPESFDSDLKTLRIWPLPLKKDPSSTKKEFTENDVRVKNVTNLASPV